MAHKAGFVNIIGRPNVGKSTLMNALIGEPLSITSSKAQTTRQRIIGLVNGDDHQIVFSDTPGIVLEPMNKLHRSMVKTVMTAIEDADVLIFLTDIYEKKENVQPLLDEIKKLPVPKIILINKIDLAKEGVLEDVQKMWSEEKYFDEILSVSALDQLHLNKLMDFLLKSLPEHPPYYPKDDSFTDRNMRFIVAEIIREKIFLHYKKEIPYSCEVVVTVYQEEPDIDRIRAEIYVERNSQKIIVIGKGGSALKKIGTEARADIEKMLDKKIYLELHVKVKEGWRDNEGLLRGLGYE